MHVDIVRKPNKITSKNPTNKSTPAIGKEKLSSLPKTNYNKVTIVVPCSSPHDSVSIDNSLYQMNIDHPQMTKSRGNNYALDSSTSTAKSS